MALAASLSRKTSPVWSYFVVCEDSKYAKCSICKQKISRGGKITKTFNTSNLVAHLKNNHIDQYKEHEQKRALMNKQL